MDSALLQTIIFFLLVAFLPSILWIVWLVRRSNSATSLGKIIFMFVWGAIFAVIIAVILEILIPGFSPRVYVSGAFFMAVIVAPFAEELAKPLGLKFAEWDIATIEDGIILGATAGLGFAATENLLYELTALNEGGWGSFWVVVVLRSFAACALHASATALTGRGYAWTLIHHKPWIAIIPFYLLAVILHGLYNYLAITNTILTFIGAMVLALVAIIATRYSLD